MNVNRGAFIPDAIIKYHDQTLQLMSLVNGIWNAANIDTRLVQTITAQDLLHANANSQIRFLSRTPGFYTAKEALQICDLPFDRLSKKTQEETQAKYDFLNEIKRNNTYLPSNKNLQGIIKKYWQNHTDVTIDMPSYQSVRRWWNRWLNADYSILALVNNHSAKGNRTEKISGDLERICNEALNVSYLTRGRGPLIGALRIARNMVREFNQNLNAVNHLKIPTITTLKSILKNIGEEEIYVLRHGADAAAAKFRRCNGYNNVDTILSRVEIDHTKLNNVIVDSVTGLATQRPWLSVATDYKSKAVMAIHLSLETPSSETLAQILKKMVSPKTELGEHDSELKHSWNMYGIPVVIAIDNGMDFHSEAFKKACQQLGISLAYMPRKRPWWKGGVERLIGTMNNGVSGIVPGGHTHRSIQEKGDLNPNKTACLTMANMEKLIIKWVVDFYHQNNHRTLKCSPQLMWDMEAEKTQIDVLEDYSILDAISGNVKNRCLFIYGLEINTLRYNSEQLIALYKTGTRKVTIRYSNEDLGQVTVLLPDGDHIVVPVHPSFAHLKGVSKTQYEACRQDLINKQLNPKHNEITDKAYHELAIMASKMAKENEDRKREYLRHQRHTKNASVDSKKTSADVTKSAANPPVISVNYNPPKLPTSSLLGVNYA